MVKIIIDEVLAKQCKTVYWLSKQTGVSQFSMGKIVKGKTTSIKFDLLEKICLALNCEAGDILKIVK
jgi:putative transcriptional regulator